MKTYGTVKRTDTGGWVITCEPDVMIKLKRLLGKVDGGSRGKVELSDTPENALDIAWFLQRYPMACTASDHLKRRAAQQMALAMKVDAILAEGYKPTPVSLAVPLREYQQIAVDLARRTGRLLLGDEVGLGKSASIIGMIADPARRPALVVTLTHLPKQWAAEIARFLPGTKVHILKHATPYPIPGKPDVVLCNYHKLDGWAETFAGQFRSVAFDECQELRRTESDKYKAAKHISARASLVCGASATPIFNFGGEIWSVMDVVAPGALGTWEEFKREWASEEARDQSKAALRDPAALGTWMRRQGLMLRRTRRDVNRELAPLTNVVHTIGSDRGALDEIAGDAAELARIILTQAGQGQKRGETMHAAEEFTNRLRQATGISKAAHVADFVRMLVESGEKVLLFGWHKAVYALWKKKLEDLNPVFFTGDESPLQKQTAKDAFVDGDAKILVMSLRAGAGIDGLQKACRTIVYGELDWSPGCHHQSSGRVHRDGQTDPVVAYYLVAEDGSDPTVADVLGVKRAQSDGMLDPTAPLVTQTQADPNRVKKLAEEFLRQRGNGHRRAA